MDDMTALEKLHELLGPKGFTSDPADSEPWLTDWRGRFQGRTLAMLSPETTVEVAGLVRICAEANLPIVPQGGNSGMVGGATPDESGRSVLLSLRRMNRIEQIDAENGLVHCQAGVVLQNLHDALEPHGQRFPLTLGGKGSATVGGLIATNAGGTQVLRHGTMRALTEGVEAVLPDGSVIDLMTPLKKDNRGYDLRNLLVGSEGTLGIVTRAILRIVPALTERCVVWAGLDSAQAAHTLLRSIDRRCGSRLEGFELIEDCALSGVLKHIPDTRSPLSGEHPWHVLVEFVSDGSENVSAEELAEEIFADALESGMIRDAALSHNETQAEQFWKLRDSIAEAERAEGPALQHDVSVPVADMARFIDEVSREVESRFPGTSALSFGHLGDGNIHFHIKAPPGANADWTRDYGKPISGFVYERVRDFDGSISAEHGIGQLKRDELSRLSADSRMHMLFAIKRAIDPGNLFNPGKLVSLAQPGHAA